MTSWNDLPIKISCTDNIDQGAYDEAQLFCENMKKSPQELENLINEGSKYYRSDEYHSHIFGRRYTIQNNHTSKIQEISNLYLSDSLIEKEILLLINHVEWISEDRLDLNLVVYLLDKTDMNKLENCSGNALASTFFYACESAFCYGNFKLRVGPEAYIGV